MLGMVGGLFLVCGYDTVLVSSCLLRGYRMNANLITVARRQQLVQ